MKRYIGFKASRYIKEYANEHYPHEACGILFGEDGIITEASGLDNRLSKADSTKHFYMDPTEIFRAEKEARLKGLSILGFFHSHPDAPAVLSKEDEEYMIPGLIYLIVSVTRDKVPEIRTYIKNSPDGEAYEINVGIKEEEGK